MLRAFFKSLLDFLNKSLLTLVTPLGEVNELVLLQEVYS